MLKPSFVPLRASFPFARGAACSLPVRWGAGTDGSIIWEQWRSQPIDPWKGRDNWFDEHHGNLLSELFAAFAGTDADAELGPPFSLALHWYQKSNTRAGGMEGAIIVGLTALDLLGAMVVVDRAAAMSASNDDNLPAKQKLARLLDVMKVPISIPAKLTDLAAFAATNGWQLRARHWPRSDTDTCTRTRSAGKSFSPRRTWQRSRLGSYPCGTKSSHFCISLINTGETETG